MSVITTALVGLNAAAVQASVLFADTARDVEFDESKVTPGPGGFFATATVAVAVILLGFLLVRRLRRISIRAEVRERIAEEQAEQQAGQQAEQQAGQRAEQQTQQQTQQQAASPETPSSPDAPQGPAGS